MKNNTNYFFAILLLVFSVPGMVFAQENVALGKQVKASSELVQFPASNLVDGKTDAEHAWKSQKQNKPPIYAEIDLHRYQTLNKLAVYLKPNLDKDAFNSIQLQYWDDANWTNIIGDKKWDAKNGILSIKLGTPLTTFMVRVFDDKASSLEINELIVTGLPATAQSYSGDAVETPSSTVTQKATVKVENVVDGESLEYVGYNQGYYLPNTNVSSWVDYSNINSMRVWTSLSQYAPTKAFHFPAVNTVKDFDAQKALVSQNPENNPFIDWKMLTSIYEHNDPPGGNRMNFKYVLAELKRLNVDPLLQINNTKFDDNWTNKFQQWLRFYAIAYYAAKTSGVNMYAMQNEPNHKAAGPMQPETWLRGLQIASDAVHTAINDVNVKYQTNIKARFVAPITAGYNTDWWALAMKHIRENYKGETTKNDLFSIFSTHSYNQPASGYRTRVSDIRKVLVENHPLHDTLPIVFTEIGRWMNSLLIDKKETYDSPSVFTEWAGIYANNMKNGAYGMWAFKFANTASSTYPEGIKSGHHLTWQGVRIVEASYPNLAINSKVIVTGGLQQQAKFITDNTKTDNSTWISDSLSTPKTVELQLAHKETINAISIYSGSFYGTYTGPDRIKNFKLYYQDGNNWKLVDGANIKGNQYTRTFIKFKKTIIAQKLKLEIEDAGRVKVREIKLFNVPFNSLPQNYNLGGIQRIGEVVRLFAKGFKDQRPLYKTTSSDKSEKFDHYTAFDQKNKTWYVWLVQRNLFGYDLDLDLSSLGLTGNNPVTAETVSENDYGEVTQATAIGNNGHVNIHLPAQSVVLLSIPAGNLVQKTEVCDADAMVINGADSKKNFGDKKKLEVSLGKIGTAQNKVSYMRFPVSKEMLNSKKTLLSLSGMATDTAVFRLHVYALASDNWSEKQLNWNNAPELDKHESLIESRDGKALICGELAFDGKEREHILDVTKVIKEIGKTNITFVLIREAREPGDDLDEGRSAIIKSKESGSGPKLTYWITK